MTRYAPRAFLAALAALALGACNSPGALDPAAPRGSPIGPGCGSSDPTRICLALKYVAYLDAAGEPAIDQDQALADLKGINNLWAACGIAFQIDEYLAVHPADFKLAFAPSNQSELDGVRRSFEDDSTLLVVATGTWNRAGTLGNSTANAWTNLPDTPPHGVVMERQVDTFANIVAHELGHYLNLLHVGDPADLMNPVIFSGSTGIYASQCAAARSTASFYWAKMYR